MNLTTSGTFYSTQEWENIEAFHAHMNAAKSGLKEAASMLRATPRTSILKRIGQSANNSYMKV